MALSTRFSSVAYDVVHDHGRDGPLGTAHIDLLVISTRHGGEGGELVRQVAANNGRHAAAVGESAGVDAVPVDEVVVVHTSKIGRASCRERV